MDETPQCKVDHDSRRTDDGPYASAEQARAALHQTPFGLDDTHAQGEVAIAEALREDSRYVTIQHGTRLWDAAEHVADLWECLAHPTRIRYGISALNRPDRQYIWLDHPDSRYAWQLPL